MANRVYISILDAKNITLSSVCTEDISVQAQSQFTRIGDFIPSIGALASMLNVGSSIISGDVGKDLLSLQNALDVPIWQKTEPVKVTMDLNFFIKTSGYYDVWRPTMILQSMNILSRNGNDLITPGLNIRTIPKNAKIEDRVAGENTLLGTLTYAKNADLDEIAAADGEVLNDSDFSTTSKFCSLYIPSIVYLPKAVVEVAQPTWSKQLSDKKYPIWSKVNVQFTGLTPAVYEDNFGCINPKKIGKIIL